MVGVPTPMGGGMFVRRVIAATDVAARHADSQVHPPAPRPEAVLATVRGRSDLLGQFDVGAWSIHGAPRSTGRPSLVRSAPGPKAPQSPNATAPWRTQYECQLALVSLLSLGIQGIAEKTGKTTVFGVEVPGSERATFIQYTFSAKLGFDGKDVKIEERGTNQYTISIPEFVFIGHDDVDLKLVTEKNGVLSWTNPKIDTLEMANHILNDKAQDGYIDSNEAVLKDQAKAYYNGIVKGIDPTIDLDFEFA